MSPSHTGVPWRSALCFTVLVAISLTWLVYGQDQPWVWWALVPVFVVVLVVWVAGMLRAAGQICDAMPLGPTWDPPRDTEDEPVSPGAPPQRTRPDLGS